MKINVKYMKYSVRNLSFLVALIILSSCAATASYGSDSEANKTKTRTFESTFDTVYRAAIEVAAEQNWSIKNSNNDAGYFLAKTPGSVKVLSDEVTVTLSKDDDNVIVIVKSKLGQKPNLEVVSKYLTELENRLIFTAPDSTG